MSKNNWTNEQLAAISTRNTNLLVSAAAGAGKTAVLVERIIRMVTAPEKPVEIDKLLVVTFTNAAATEMRERIGAALTAQLSINPRSSHLIRQVSLLNLASITTLHSFCLDLIRRNFYKLDLDPGFRIADEVEAELLRLEAIEEVFERRYQDGETSLFARLVDTYGGQRDDSKLQDLVMQLFRFSSSNPWPKQWLHGLADNFNVASLNSLDNLVWIKEIKTHILRETTMALGLIKEALELAEKPGGPAGYIANLNQDICALEELQGSCQKDWNAMYLCFSSMSWGKLKPVKAEVDEEIKERVQELRNKAKDKINELKNTFFCVPMSEVMADLQALFQLIGELGLLTTDFIDAYQKKKENRGLVDFGDLEHLCLRLLLEPGSTPGSLIPSTVALELQGHFEEVLVDEYQDINEIQETILQLISKPNNRFMVGDVKQSIYRFRLAEPALFLKKHAQFNLDSGTGKVVNLTKNFRSRQGVINAVNYLFSQIMTRNAGEVDYDAAAELRFGADYPPLDEEKTELHIIDRNKDTDAVLNNVEHLEEPGNEEQEEIDADQAEARLVGTKILQLVSASASGSSNGYRVWDRVLGEYRPVSFRDIVILLRATTGRANVFVEELRNLGIPTYADLGTGYFEAVEVDIFLSLLKIIDNPRQDIQLAGVLRSPIVGLNANELAQIRIAKGHGDFFDAVKAAASETSDELSLKLSDFLQSLDRWRTQARRGSLADLIWELFRETGFYDYVGGMVGGNQRQANLRLLYHRAKQYEATSFRGLFRFLRFMEKIRASGSDLGAARALGENEDVVRIMSIHKSKGLEFPVVFVAGLGRQFNMMDLNNDVLMHKELGLGPQIVNTETRVAYPSLLKTLIKNRLRNESLAEEMRVLYVALTRAREKLILVGSVRDLEKARENWAAQNSRGWQLNDSTILNAKSCLDWLCPAVIRHRQGRVLMPQGKTLAGIPYEIENDLSGWQVSFSHAREMLYPNLSNNEKQENILLDKISQLQSLEDMGLYKEVQARLGWEYSFKEVAGKAAKITVTEIKRRFEQLESEESGNVNVKPGMSKQPRFMQQDRGLTAAEKGTAMHTVMQHVKLQQIPEKADIVELLESLKIRELLTPEQVKAVDPNQVVQFFHTPLGQRVMNSIKVQRELPFCLAIPAEEVYPELQPEQCKGEYVLVQGVIDCLLDEGDGLILIDYKSDAVRPGQESPAERYRGQIKLYARAVESILGKKVKEGYIYLFETGEAIST